MITRETNVLALQDVFDLHRHVFGSSGVTFGVGRVELHRERRLHFRR